jgi:hypothetical protein
LLLNQIRGIIYDIHLSCLHAREDLVHECKSFDFFPLGIFTSSALPGRRAVVASGLPEVTGSQDPGRIAAQRCSIAGISCSEDLMRSDVDHFIRTYPIF